MKKINRHSGVYLVKGWKWILQKIFGFDKWHIAALQERSYALGIVEYCNSRKKRTACVEIGCGLGDILVNINYEKKYGLDSDKRVLRAASFINKFNRGPRTRYKVFQFPDDTLQEKYDVIIMVNWIHHIEPAVLESKVKEYITNYLFKDGELILDTVQDSAYKFNHSIDTFSNQDNVSVVKIGAYERQRVVWAIKKKE